MFESVNKRFNCDIKLSATGQHMSGTMMMMMVVMMMIMKSTCD